MYSRICAEWVVDHFGLGLTQIDPLLTKIIRAKTMFTFSFPVTLTLDLKFAPLVNCVQRYVSAKVEFLRHSYFEKIRGTRRTDGQTDGRTGSTLNAAVRRGSANARRPEVFINTGWLYQ